MIETRTVRWLLAFFFVLGGAAGWGIGQYGHDATAPAASSSASAPSGAAVPAATMPPAASNGLPWATNVDVQLYDHLERIKWLETQVNELGGASMKQAGRIHDLELVERSKKAAP